MGKKRSHGMGSFPGNKKADVIAALAITAVVMFTIFGCNWLFSVMGMEGLTVIASPIGWVVMAFFIFLVWLILAFAGFLRVGIFT